MSKEKELEQITITRATVVHGKGRVERGQVLTVGAQISEGDARLLMNINKAVEGKVKLDDKGDGK